jgi:hypothetical protein
MNEDPVVSAVCVDAIRHLERLKREMEARNLHGK